MTSHTTASSPWAVSEDYIIHTLKSEDSNNTVNSVDSNTVKSQDYNTVGRLLHSDLASQGTRTGTVVQRLGLI